MEIEEVQTNIKIEKKAKPKKQTTSKSDEPEIIEIYADTRERNCNIVKILEERFKCKVNIKQLEIGDYVISNDVVIERKTVSDFISSLLDRRLFNQIMAMTKNYEMPLIILEGNPEMLFYETNIHRNAIIGALSAVCLEYKTPLLFAADEFETAEFIYVIAKRFQLGKNREISLHGKKPKFSIAQEQQYVVESLPLIGPLTAKNLLNHFKTVKDFVNADKKELAECEGIGKIKAKKIREVLDKRYKEKDADT